MPQAKTWTLREGRRPLLHFGDGPLSDEQFLEAAERYMAEYLDVTIEDIKRNGPYVKGDE